MRASSHDRISIERAERLKEQTYPELVNSPIVRLTTLACKIGGRWSPLCIRLIRALAISRSRSAPQHLRFAARLAYENRWWALLSVSQQSALAATLVEDGAIILDGIDSFGPLPADVIQDDIT